MIDPLPNEKQDVFFSDGDVNYRTFPSGEYLWRVIKRNVYFIAALAFIIAPVAAIKILTTTKIYESSVILRFDPSDSFQVETRSSEAVFVEVMQSLARELDDQTFLTELSDKFSPSIAEYPAYIISNRYPELQILRWFISAPQKEPDTEKRGKYLRSRLNLSADSAVRGNTLMRITANGPTIEDAQKLATIASNLLAEKFYKKEIERVAIGVKSITDFISNDKVRKLVENARKESIDMPEILGQKKNSLDALKEIRARQQSSKSRIREINEEMRATIARRAQLEASLAELARKYGPFHPERKAVESEITDLKGKDGTSNLSKELRNLEAQLADAEADADSIVAAEETEERADKMILKIFGRLDRLKLEQQKLEEQVSKPDQRTRLAQIGAPSTPLTGSSKRLQIAVVSMAAVLGGGFVLTIIRETTRKIAIDKWRIDWILNLPCIVRIHEKYIEKLNFFEKKTIQHLKQKVSKNNRKDAEIDAFLAYRSLGLWVKNEAKGQVLLFLRGSQNPKNINFVNQFASVYSRDYAGKYLVLDMNGAIGQEGMIQDDRGNLLLEIILQKRTLESANSRQNIDRGFDLLLASQGMEHRLSEVISSAKFAEFMMSARRIYHKIFIIGLAAESFIENDALRARASDAVVLVDTKVTTIDSLGKICTNIGREHINGYVLIEG